MRKVDPVHRMGGVQCFGINKRRQGVEFKTLRLVPDSTDRRFDTNFNRRRMGKESL